MHYLIHIPGVRGADAKHLERVGLADHVAGADMMECVGPNGPGMMFAWRSPDALQFNYLPQQQEWIPAAQTEDGAKGRYYVGIWKDKPPTPRELKRPYPYRGKDVDLLDEQTWTIPKALELDAISRLQDDGTYKFEILRRFHAFWMESLSWAIIASEGKPFDYSDACAFVVRALSINYRITPEVADRLELFSKRTIVSSIYAVLGTNDG